VDYVTGWTIVVECTQQNQVLRRSFILAIFELKGVLLRETKT
jgi:hypothetical protein